MGLAHESPRAPAAVLALHPARETHARPSIAPTMPTNAAQSDPAARPTAADLPLRYAENGASRHLQRHPIPRQQTLRQQPQALRCARHAAAERTFPSSQIATTQNPRCTSRPIPRPTHLTNDAIVHLHKMVVDTDRWENQREKRHRPIRAPTLNPGKSQGRPIDFHGLEAHRRKRPTRLRSPMKGPYPGSPDRRPGDRTDPPSRIFMPRSPRSAYLPKESAADCS
jgi:hypothetical protein